MAKETITIDVAGIPEAIANIKWYEIVKSQAVKDILLEHGFKIETDAKRTVPVKDGFLKGSISTNWSGSGMDRGRVDSPAVPEDGVGQPSGKPGMIVVVGSNKAYARRIEIGFRKADKLGRKYNQEPRPYLHPAYIKHEGKCIKRIGNVLKDTKK